MPLLTIFVRNRSLGSVQVSENSVTRQGVFRNNSVALWCPHCGEAWARLHVSSSTYCSVRLRPCEKHGDGRLTYSWPDEAASYFTEEWPAAAIRWEFEAASRYYLSLFAPVGAEALKSDKQQGAFL